MPKRLLEASICCWDAKELSQRTEEGHSLLSPMHKMSVCNMIMSFWKNSVSNCMDQYVCTISHHKWQHKSGIKQMSWSLQLIICEIKKIWYLTLIQLEPSVNLKPMVKNERCVLFYLWSSKIQALAVCSNLCNVNITPSYLYLPTIKTLRDFCLLVHFNFYLVTILQKLVDNFSYFIKFELWKNNKFILHMLIFRTIWKIKYLVFFCN